MTTQVVLNPSDAPDDVVTSPSFELSNHPLFFEYHRPFQTKVGHTGTLVVSEKVAQDMGAVKCQVCWPEGRE